MSIKYLDPTGIGYFWYKIKSLVSTKYTKPDTGIPKSDLESSVQTTLTNADSIVNNFSNKIDKVNGATAGNIAILNATGSITDGNTSIQNVELNIDTNGHTYVDLGLPSGTLWATCNVGATNPEDYGNYYAWGETQTKQEYSWNTYQHGSSGNITKYNSTDGKTELEPDDDVCHIVMGGDWRMPTEVQCKELTANTTYSWTTINGITGILLTSTINNNTLFIPASGYINNTSTTDLTTQSCIWSSNLYIHETYGIMGVSELSYRETGSMIVVSNDRYKGYPCRGVINKSGIEFKQGKTIMPVKTTASAVEFPDGETAISKVSDLEENKVDKVSGKSLSTNDYTTEDKTKLSNIASGAQVNVLETVKVNDNPLTITNKSVNIDLSNYAQKDGSYSGMTVGAAEDLVSAESVASEFTSRITGGSTAVGKGGTALVDKIKGRTLVWNQACKYMDVSNTVNGVTITVSDNRIVLSGTATSNIGRTGMYLSPGIVKLITGHKYIYINTVGVQFYVTSQSLAGSLYQWFANTSDIFTFTKSSFSDGLVAPVVSAGTECNYSGYFYIIDLTLMFGAGNEPSTVDEFEALYPGPYYDYNAGTLISNAATAIETVGFNQWDEEWETGMVNPTDGTNVSSNTQIRSSYIPVIGGADYFFPTKTYIVCTYDANKKFLSCIKYSTAGVTRTLDNNAAYLRFCTYTDYGATYKNDICISLSDPSRNGTYEPYWRSELDLNIPTLTGKLNGAGSSVVIFPDGMKKAGTVYDELQQTKARKQVDEVDLGLLSWTYNSIYQYFYADVPGRAMVENNVICAKYTNTSEALDGNQQDKTIRSNSSNIRVYITDRAYSSASSFTTAVTGTKLFFQLATPKEYILDNALPTAMRNDPYGTERRLPEDSAAIVTAPFRADITYSTNIKEAVLSMHQNFINVNSMQDFLAELGTLMGGTWTMSPADGKFTFTFTQNEQPIL